MIAASRRRRRAALPRLRRQRVLQAGTYKFYPIPRAEREENYYRRCTAKVVDSGGLK